MGRYYNDYLAHSYEDEDELVTNSDYYSRYWDDYLTHFGIKGMHWGQRRYQTEGGEYTEAGMVRRYGHGHLDGKRISGSSGGSGGSSTRSSKKKGWSTAAKVAAGLAGAAAVGAAGYAVYKNKDAIGEKINEGKQKYVDRFVENEIKKKGWTEEGERQRLEAYNKATSDVNKLSAAYAKTAKPGSTGMEYASSGDQELWQALRSAQNLQEHYAKEYTGYKSTNPDKMRESHSNVTFDQVVGEQKRRLKEDLFTPGSVKAARAKKDAFAENRRAEDRDKDLAKVDKALGREHQKSDYQKKTVDEKLAKKTSYNPEVEDYYRKKVQAANKYADKANSEYEATRKETVEGGTRYKSKGDLNLQNKVDDARKVANKAAGEYNTYRMSSPDSVYKSKQETKQVKKEIKQEAAKNRKEMMTGPYKNGSVSKNEVAKSNVQQINRESGKVNKTASQVGSVKKNDTNKSTVTKNNGSTGSISKTNKVTEKPKSNIQLSNKLRNESQEDLTRRMIKATTGVDTGKKVTAEERAKHLNSLVNNSDSNKKNNSTQNKPTTNTSKKKKSDDEIDVDSFDAWMKSDSKSLEDIDKYKKKK
jgi:hypothetical protein